MTARNWAALAALAFLLACLPLLGQHSQALRKAEAASNGYNVTFSKTVIGYGVLSYCPKKCIENWDCELGNKYPKLINVTHVNNDITLAAAYIGYEPISKFVYVSWRGSANAENWIEDFTIAMEPFEGCKGCYIHVGFHADYHLNEKKLQKALDTLLAAYDVQRIVLTGHSMGAAVASIHGLYLALQNLKVPIQVHHFGSPRIGNENLAQFIHVKVPDHYRVVHYKDLVPHLPPEVEYKHAPFEIFFDKNMSSYQVCDVSGEDHRCSNQFFPDYNPGDHNFYFFDLGKELKC